MKNEYVVKVNCGEEKEFFCDVVDILEEKYIVPELFDHDLRITPFIHEETDTIELCITIGNTVSITKTFYMGNGKISYHNLRQRMKKVFENIFGSGCHDWNIVVTSDAGRCLKEKQLRKHNTDWYVNELTRMVWKQTGKIKR